MKKLKTLLIATLAAANIYTLINSDKQQEEQPTLLSIENYEFDYYNSYLHGSVPVDHDTFIGIKVAYTIIENENYCYLLDDLNANELAVTTMILDIEKGQ